MIDRRASIRLLMLGGAAVGVAACAGGAPAAPGQSAGTVLEVARANRLTRFLRAVEASGLDATLTGEGPFTLFAPNNRAFGGADLPEDTEALRALVAYHVVPGMFTTDFLVGMDVNYTTLSGESLNVDGTAGLRVNGATIVTPDLGAGNGVVNVIDRVLVPR